MNGEPHKYIKHESEGNNALHTTNPSLFDILCKMIRLTMTNNNILYALNDERDIDEIVTTLTMLRYYIRLLYLKYYSSLKFCKDFVLKKCIRELKEECVFKLFLTSTLQQCEKEGFSSP